MDKVMMFKLGRFYEAFFEDGVVLNLVLGYGWMGGIHKVHTGFPETQLLKVSQKLVNIGFEVAVIDQTETNIMAEERLNIDRNKN